MVLYESNIVFMAFGWLMYLCEIVVWLLCVAFISEDNLVSSSTYISKFEYDSSFELKEKNKEATI